jgi:hypothetical protein
MSRINRFKERAESLQVSEENLFWVVLCLMQDAQKLLKHYTGKEKERLVTFTLMNLIPEENTILKGIAEKAIPVLIDAVITLARDKKALKMFAKKVVCC